MKDFLLILIMSGTFTFFIAGLLYLHISEQRIKIEKAYKKGLNERQRKIGYWRKGNSRYIICSECNMWIDPYGQIMKYCPMCGAEMEGKENG